MHIIQTHQHQLFSSDSLPIERNSNIKEYSDFNDDVMVFENDLEELASYVQPLHPPIPDYMHYNNVENKQALIDDSIRNASAMYIQSQSYLPQMKAKKSPKARFFGGFLKGAVTVLEAAVKVNIPIPFCQFPNSPCKIIRKQYSQTYSFVQCI